MRSPACPMREPTAEDHMMWADCGVQTTVTPLYDRAALDAAVAAERERWVGACQSCYAHVMASNVGAARSAAADCIMAIRRACGA